MDKHPTDSSLDRRLLLGAAGLAGIAALASHRATAGPLNPPAGPVASTAKPLAELEPRIPINATNTPGNIIATYHISQPGSYYLTGNLTGEAGKMGIEVTANDVTIDLNGFALIGVANSNEGIGTGNAPLRSGITVRNGSIRGWGEAGIQFRTSQLSECRIQGVTAIGNAGPGIAVHAQSHITDCMSIGNSAGIVADLSCTIERCTAVANSAEGINAFDSCTIRDCAAHRNTLAGITAVAATTITGCSCLANGGDGIAVGYRGHIAGNHCIANGAGAASGAGIHVLPSAGAAGNRIEGNTCETGDRGYFVESAGNILLRNVSLANAIHWSVAAGNYGLVLSAAASGPYIGNAGGTPLAAAGYDPNANMTIF
ncbi:MAG TPA: right-handed parallel beta-helix repeat-containing protein [Phycisphaerales bacterium]|nr:right-handed parallel beta-helix repeat-containing protein [Phycisphaerales bacterium]